MHRTEPVNRRHPVTLLIAVLLLAAACGDGGSPGGEGGTDGQDGPRERFSVRLGFFLTGPRMPYVVAQVRGYYEDENLEVTVLEGEGTTINAQLVTSGDVLIAEGDTSGVVALRKQGITLRNIAVFGQKSPIAILGWKSHGVSSPADLEGKRLGTTAGSSPQLLFPAFAEGAGIDPGAIQILPLEPAAKFTIFLNEDVDAIDTFITSTPPQYFETRDDFTTFLYSDFGLNVLSDGLFVTEETAEQKGDALRGFLRAVLRAWEECDVDPQACAQDSVRFKDTADPTLLVNQWEISKSLWRTEAAEGLPLGCTAEADREATIRTLQEVRLLTSDVDPSQAYTNEFLPGC